ncbi:MAG: RdgB/HAM1 family non-canonical purine NTP pyrophosphatase [Pseudomonadota bacterium]
MGRRFDREELVIASHNAGKLSEIRALLAPFGITVTSAGMLGLEEPDETESTFAGNARLKARAVVRATGLPALSDDSGIAVAALDGAPGVYTADWAETPDGRDFGQAMARVWAECEARSAPKPRAAVFVSTLCLAWPDGHEELVTGDVHGTLTWPARGQNGFGYDPMFVPEGEELTFGEMEPEQKAALSHRKRAFDALVEACFDR